MTTLTPVDSSLISGIYYNPAKETLTVKFQKGDVYVYRAVPPQVFSAMQEAKSAGKFFLTNVKKQYECIKEEA